MAFQQIGDRRGGQMRLEGGMRLFHQRDPVGQKQHPPHHVRPHQLVDQRDDRPRLARAGGHHQQRLAGAVLSESIAHAADGANLVRALDNGLIHRHLIQRFDRGAALDQQFQLVAFQEAADRARRISRIVPQPMIVAVGAEYQRAAAMGSFKAIRVKLGLLLADEGVLFRALGLDHRQRLAVGAPEHIIDKALTAGIGHARDRKFAVAGLVQGPAGFGQQQVDIGVPRRGLVIIVRVGDFLVFAPGGQNFGAQAGQFGLKRKAAFLGLAAGFLGGIKALLRLGMALGQVLDFLHRGGGDGQGLFQPTRVELQRGRGLGACGIGARDPVADMEQLAHRADSRRPGDRLAAVMGGAVAQIADEMRLGDDLRPGQFGKAWLGDQGGKIVVIGPPQRRVAGVKPFHRDFQRQPCPETGAARIRERGFFRLAGIFEQRGEFGFQECELAQSIPRQFGTARLKRGGDFPLILAGQTRCGKRVYAGRRVKAPRAGIGPIGRGAEYPRSRSEFAPESAVLEGGEEGFGCFNCVRIALSRL